MTKLCMIYFVHFFSPWSWKNKIKNQSNSCMNKEISYPNFVCANLFISEKSSLNCIWIFSSSDSLFLSWLILKKQNIKKTLNPYKFCHQFLWFLTWFENFLNERLEAFKNSIKHFLFHDFVSSFPEHIWQNKILQRFKNIPNKIRRFLNIYGCHIHSKFSWNTIKWL